MSKTCITLSHILIKSGVFQYQGRKRNLCNEKHQNAKLKATIVAHYSEKESIHIWHDHFNELDTNSANRYQFQYIMKEMNKLSISLIWLIGLLRHMN